MILLLVLIARCLSLTGAAPTNYSAVLNNSTLITFTYTQTDNIDRNAVTFQAYLSTVSVGSIDIIVDVDTENVSEESLGLQLPG